MPKLRRPRWSNDRGRASTIPATLDILGSGHTSLTESFEKTPAFKWLVEHCAEYGFILRYPKGKENITAVIYEPWHYRYVGVEAAKEIMSRDITLEEYIQEKGM